MNLYEPCTQAEFGGLIGVTQQAVSDMIERGVLVKGLPLGNWLHEYCGHLREQAAGRDSDLATERALETKVRREQGEIKLAVMRKEFAPVGVLEQILANLGRGVAGLLEPLPGELSKLNPALTPEDVALIQRKVSEACDKAASASLAMLDEPEEGAGGAAGFDLDPDEPPLDDDDEPGGAL